MRIDEKAPIFSLQNQDGDIVSLSDFKGKWLIIYFYPRDNTPGCSIEGIDFTALKNKFDSLNAEIVGVSADSIASHCKFIAKKNLTINLLSDEDKIMINSFGVWRPKKFMGKEFLGIVRSTFLINPGGIIKYIWDPVKVKSHAQKVLEKLQELQ